MQEVLNIAAAQEYISQGGVEYAHEILEKALGANKAMEIINRLQGSLQMTPFDYIKRTDPQQLLNFIQSEHPQTIALILAHLTPDHAATILGALPGDVQVDVATRIAILDRAAPDVVMEIERVLETPYLLDLHPRIHRRRRGPFLGGGPQSRRPLDGKSHHGEAGGVQSRIGRGSQTPHVRL